jgi:hypothetical protein
LLQLNRNLLNRLSKYGRVKTGGKISMQVKIMQIGVRPVDQVRILIKTRIETKVKVVDLTLGLGVKGTLHHQIQGQISMGPSLRVHSNKEMLEVLVQTEIKICQVEATKINSMVNKVKISKTQIHKMISKLNVRDEDLVNGIHLMIKTVKIQKLDNKTFKMLCLT